MILQDPLTTFIESEQCPVVPEIEAHLLIPCYEDLLPVESKGSGVESKLRLMIDDYSKMKTCYRRQYDLIKEVRRVRTIIERQ